MPQPRGGVIVLEDSNDEAPPLAIPVSQGNLGQGSSRDGGGVKEEDNDGGDYSAFGKPFDL